MKIHAQIMYRNEDGSWVHSDICPKHCEVDGIEDKWDEEGRLPSYRDFLHASLDEYLDEVVHQGRGYFYIGNGDDIEPVI